MRPLIAIAILLLLSACSGPPATPQSPLSKARAELMAKGATVAIYPGHYAEAHGPSMGGAHPSNAWLLFVEDYDAVAVGQDCGYTWQGGPILHRVRGQLGHAWVMQGILNTEPDPGLMTQHNYLGTYVGYILFAQ